MLKQNVSKKPFFIKSLLSRLQRKRTYLKALEADFVSLRIENEMLKKRACL